MSDEPVSVCKYFCKLYGRKPLRGEPEPVDVASILLNVGMQGYKSISMQILFILLYQWLKFNCERAFLVNLCFFKDLFFLLILEFGFFISIISEELIPEIILLKNDAI